MTRWGVLSLATSDTTGYDFPYEYKREDTGRVLQVIHRVRMVRRGRGRWVGRVDETQTVDGPIYNDRSVRPTCNQADTAEMVTFRLRIAAHGSSSSGPV